LPWHPFLFGYKNLRLNVWLPQVIAGISVILLVLVSKTNPQVNATSLTAAVDAGRSQRVGSIRAGSWHDKCERGQLSPLTVGIAWPLGLSQWQESINLHLIR
jgi:hypothetical protein